eukprot:PhF_6_TR21720/c0_g1_i1/m.31035
MLFRQRYCSRLEDERKGYPILTSEETNAAVTAVAQSREAWETALPFVMSNPGNVGTIESYLAGLGRCGLWEAVLRVTMSLTPPIPTSVCDRALRSLSRSATHEVVLDTFDKLVQEGHLFPTYYTIRTLVDVVGKNYEWLDAIQIYEELIHVTKPHPDAVTKLVEVCMGNDSDGWHGALRVLQYTREGDHKDAFSPVQLAFIAQGFTHSHRWEHQISLCANVLMEGIECSEKYVRNVMECMVKCDRVKEALQVWSLRSAMKIADPEEQSRVQNSRSLQKSLLRFLETAELCEKNWKHAIDILRFSQGYLQRRHVVNVVSGVPARHRNVVIAALRRIGL